jgi:uncharacterized protein (DUF305 family)
VSLVHLRSSRSTSAPRRDRATPNTIVAAVVLASVALIGCSSDDDAVEVESTAPVVQLGGPGETNRVLTDEETDQLGAPGHTDADVAFVHAMLAHHAQALAMTSLVPDRAAREDLPLFAERIDVSQHDEIAQLEAWLTERGEKVVLEDGAHLAHGELAPGMLTAEEIAQLQEASGRRFDRLFLQYMLRHHEGAVIMVEDLLNEGAGGQEPAIFQLAQHIASDQQIEISRMKQMLSELQASG